MRKTRLLVASLVTAALIASTSVIGAAVAADAPDAWVTMKTKIALITTEGVSTQDLNVDTVNGVVTLHGKVALESEKSTAERVARGVEGVKEVKNLLQVIPEARRARVDAADETIKSDVQAAFHANRRLMGSGVDVASVNQGVVLLSGRAASIEVYLEAVEVADAVRGVKRVATEVQVKP